MKRDGTNKFLPSKTHQPQPPPGWEPMFLKMLIHKGKHKLTAQAHLIGLIRTGSNCLGSGVWRDLISVTRSFTTWLCDSIQQNTHCGIVWVRHHVGYHGGYEDD